MPNPFCHVELHAGNVGQATTFYSKLFDWTLEEMPMGEMNYTMVQVGDGTGGGIMQNPVPDAPSHWLPYVLVDNLADATEKAKSLGATVMNDATKVPNMGQFSVIADPTGAVIGLWEPTS